MRRIPFQKCHLIKDVLIFFDSDSESDSESEPGDLENTIDEMQEKLDEIITLRKQFRAKLPEILGVDIKKRKRLLKKISAYTIKGMDQTVGIDPDEDSDEDESDNEDSNEDEEEDAGEVPPSASASRIT